MTAILRLGETDRLGDEEMGRLGDGGGISFYRNRFHRLGVLISTKLADSIPFFFERYSLEQGSFAYNQKFWLLP